MLTKKAKLEQFDEVSRQRGLLERYFWDSRDGDMKPEARSRVRTKDGDVFVFSVFFTDRPHGGYIVVEQPNVCGVPSIEWWDVFTDKTLRLTDYCEWSLAMRRGLEELKHELYAKNQKQVA